MKALPNIAEQPGYDERTAAKTVPGSIFPEFAVNAKMPEVIGLSTQARDQMLTRMLLAVPKGAAVPVAPYPETKLFDEAKAYSKGIQAARPGDVMAAIDERDRAEREKILGRVREAMERGKRVVVHADGIVSAVYNPPNDR